MMLEGSAAEDSFFSICKTENLSRPTYSTQPLPGKLML